MRTGAIGDVEVRAVLDFGLVVERMMHLGTVANETARAILSKYSK